MNIADDLKSAYEDGYEKGFADGFEAGQRDVQPERKKGKWIMGKCDQCGAHAPFWEMASTYYESDFCPNCGADMRGTT